MEENKQAVHDFWNAASCGETQYLPDSSVEAYAEEARVRYLLEPYIPRFAGFSAAAGRDVLEIGVGLGADHAEFARGGARLQGIDLTERAVQHASRRLASMGLVSSIRQADAENLPFGDQSFDIVYSWGVIHHSPNTPVAVSEIWRVLRPGGVAKIMIYNKHCLIGYMLWVRYALLRGRPWLSLEKIYDRYLESPGTKAYTVAQARRMFGRFAAVEIETVLTHGDLLSSDAGQRHRGMLLDVARFLWPRRLFQTLLPGFGLFMLITARK